MTDYTIWVSTILFSPSYDLAKAKDGGTVYFTQDPEGRYFILSEEMESLRGQVQVKSFIRRLEIALGEATTVEEMNSYLSRECNGFFFTEMRVERKEVDGAC